MSPHASLGAPTGVVPHRSEMERVDQLWPHRFEGTVVRVPGSGAGRGVAPVSTCTRPVHSLHTHSWHTQGPHHKANAYGYLLTKSPLPPLFSGLTSTFPSHLPTQLAQNSHICCRRGGGQGDWRGPLLTRVSSPLPRSSQGFMHMKLSWTKEHKYVLGQNSPPFSTVPEIVHHYASRKLPIKGAKHMSLLYPVAIRTL